MIRSNPLRVAALAGAGLILASCASGRPGSARVADCRERFETLQERYQNRKYSQVKQAYSGFAAACAGTEYAEPAHFMGADAHFRLKEWMEAEHEFSAFLRDYPASRRYAETARWLLALSMGRQVLHPQRDQGKTLEAIRELETFLAEFPSTARADSARGELERLGRRLAERDMLIARLYTRMNEPLAAAIYYRHLLREHGDRIPRREINLLLAESYVALNQFVEAENILAQFDGVAADDPFRAKVAKARRDLERAREKHERQRREERRRSEAPST